MADPVTVYLTDVLNGEDKITVENIASGVIDGRFGSGDTFINYVAGIKEVSDNAVTPEEMYAYITVKSVQSIDDIYSVDTSAYNVLLVEGSRGGTFIYDASRSTEIDYGTVFYGWVRVFNGIAYSKMFGCVADGTTDDTLALQRFFNSSYKKIKLSNGYHRIVDTNQDGTPVLTSSVSDRTISGKGYLYANTTVLKAFHNSGDNCEIELKIEGNSNINSGIENVGNYTKIENCNIQNLYSSTYQAIAIECENAIGCSIKNNYIKNINSVGTTGSGYARGILWSHSSEQTEKSIIKGNEIIDVLGLEGDSIAVLNSNGAGVYYSCNVSISANMIDVFSRRAIKIQAHKACVNSNDISNNVETHANPATVIDFVQGGNHVAKDNIIDGAIQFGAISSYALEGESFDKFIIDGNIIKNREGSVRIDISIISRGNGVSIINNTINGGSYKHIAVSALSKVRIKNNDIIGEASDTNSVISIGNNGLSSYIVENNTYEGGARQSMIDTSSQIICKDNTCISETPIFKDTAGNTDSYVDNNILVGDAAFYSDVDSRYNRFGGNTRIGQGTMYFSAPLYVASNSSPSTFLVGKYINQSQIVYKATPVAGSTVGWIAVDSGLAEVVTWKEFGVIAT